jgi:hypothetical protein
MAKELQYNQGWSLRLIMPPFRPKHFPVTSSYEITTAKKNRKTVICSFKVLAPPWHRTIPPLRNAPKRNDYRGVVRWIAVIWPDILGNES